MTDLLRINGMRFDGHHGVLEEERARPRPFEVDVEVVYDQRAAAASDDLASAVDVREVGRLVREVIGGESCALIETLAQRVADRLLEIPLVEEVAVRVRKPRAFLIDDEEYPYEVEIRRSGARSEDGDLPGRVRERDDR